MELNKFLLSAESLEVSPSPVVHNKGARNNKGNPKLIRHEWFWTLHGYAGKVESNWLEQVSFIPPTHVLNDQLSTEVVLAKLNSEDCFDFDYKPNEGDNLNVVHKTWETRNKTRYFGINYLSFIYRNAEWQIDYYDPEVDDTKFIRTGSLVWT